MIALLHREQLGDVRLAHVFVAVAVDVAPGADEFRIIELQPRRQGKGLDVVQRQGVEFIVRLFTLGDELERMRVIVDGFDLCNLSGERRIGCRLRA